MNKNSSIIIGHLSRDIDIDFKGATTETFGGGAIYAGSVAIKLGYNPQVIFKCNSSDFEFIMDKYKYLKKYSELIEIPKTHVMQNEYFSENRNERVTKCIYPAEAFNSNDLSGLFGYNNKVIYFAGLIAGDFDIESIVKIGQKNKIAVDAQGFLRHISKDNDTLISKDNPEINSVIKSSYYFKMDYSEGQIITNENDRKSMCKYVFDKGAKEIVLSNADVITVFDGNNFYQNKITAKSFSGRTGRGDTVFSAYIHERMKKSISDSLLYATAAVSLKVEKNCPYNYSQQDLEEYISKNKSELIV